MNHIIKITLITTSISFFFGGCNSESPSSDPGTIQSEGDVRKTETNNSDHESTNSSLKVDSRKVAEWTKNFKGIEYYFIKLSKIYDKELAENSWSLMIDNWDEMAQKIKLLLEYKKHATPEIFAHIEPFHYSIQKLDSKNGYMFLNCNDCENRKYLALWNKDEESRLIGTVDRGCGPACTDEVNFYLEKNDKLVKVKTESIVPVINDGSFYNDPSKYSGNGNDDPGLAYNLPETGTNILVTLDLSERDKTLFKGDCIELIWNRAEGSFKLGNVYFKN